MRYPLWAFAFVFALAPMAAHALLVGSARFDPDHAQRARVMVKERADWNYRRVNAADRIQPLHRTIVVKPV